MKSFSPFIFFMLATLSMLGQRVDIYYAGIYGNADAAVFKNTDLLYHYVGQGLSGPSSIIRTADGDFYYAGLEMSNVEHGRVWKNDIVFFAIEPKSYISDVLYDENEGCLYSVGYIFNGNMQKRASIWKNDMLLDTIGIDAAEMADIDCKEGHIYTCGKEGNRLIVWKDHVPFYELGVGESLNTLICKNDHVFTCGNISTDEGQEGRVWKDEEVLFTYGEGSTIYDFIIEGEDVYACGRIDGNGVHKGVVWKNDSVLYEFGYEYRGIVLYDIKLFEDNLYCCGSYYERNRGGLFQPKGIIMKNGEEQEIADDCSEVRSIIILNGSSNTHEMIDYAFHLYPNPTTGQFTVEGANAAKVEVYNYVGKKVSEQQGSKVVNINASGWNKGIYFVNIIVENSAIVTKKLMVR